MIIESINIKSFGMITDMTLNFAEDLIVIVGHNEAGKSTIAAFIKYMLYGFGNDGSADAPDERTRRINWENGTAQGSMTVRTGEKRYMITRVTERVDNGGRYSYKEDASIIDMETGSPAFGKVPAGEVFFGVDKDLFENTAFVGQIGDSAINEGSVKQSIENILFSGSERINNQRAASKVAVKKETLLHKTGGGGDIYELGRRAEQLEERFKSADEDNREILAKEAKLHDIKTRRKEQVGYLDKFTDLDVCYRNVLIIQSFDELHKLEESCEKKAEEYNSFIAANTRADFVPNEAYLTDIAVCRRSVDDAYRNLMDAEDRYEREKQAAGITKESETEIERCDELGGESAIIAKAKGIRKQQIKSFILGGASVLILIAELVYQLAIKGALAGVLLRILFALPGVAALAGVGYAAYCIIREKKQLAEIQTAFSTVSLDDLISKLTVIGEEREKRDKLLRDTDDARTALENAKANYERAKGELLSVILRWGEEPPTSNLNDFLNGLETKVKTFLDEEKVILAEKTELEIAVREIRKQLADKSEIDIRAQVSPLKRKVLSEIDHESILNGINECKMQIAALDKLAEEVEDELAMLKIRATDPGELYAKMQENDARIEELTLQHAACEMALRAIESASDNLRLEISPRLGEYSASLMQVMTDKKYSDIDVSDGFMVSFTAPDGEKKSVDFLSGGTRDLTYISLRMALIDMLYTEKPPVCFDESFAHQDNARAKSMMKAIKKLAAEGQQSFIFTCREREATLAKECCKKAGIFKLTVGDDDIA